MIFHKLKCIHMHVGKAAGTSIESMLFNGPVEKALDVNKPNYDYFYGWNGKIYLQHATLKYMAQYTSMLTLKEYFKFTVIRNPFTLIRSVYMYDGSIEKKYGSFKNFVLDAPNRVKLKNREDGDHNSPQHYYTHMDGQQFVDKVIKMENLSNDIELIKDKLNLAHGLPFFNKSRPHNIKSVPLSELYDEKMVQAALDAYGKDFELFDYSPKP